MPRPAPLLWLAVAATAAAAPTYDAHINHPAHVGDRFDVTGHVEQHRVTTRTVAGEPATTQSTDRRATLVAHCTVLSVSRSNLITGLRCDVVSMTDAVDGRPVQTLPAGASVDVINRRGRTSFLWLGGGATAGREWALGHLLPVAPPDAPTPDEWFPPGGQHAVGDTWPMDPAAAVAYARATGNPPPARATGHVKLLGIADVMGRPALTIEEVRDVDGLRYPDPLPKGITTAAGRQSNTVVVSFPVDRAVMAYHFHSNGNDDWTYDRAADDGRPMVEQVHRDTSVEVTRVPATQP